MRKYPFKVKRTELGWLVIDQSNGMVVGNFASRREAREHQVALNRNAHAASPEEKLLAAISA